MKWMVHMQRMPIHTYTHFPHVLCIRNGILPGLNIIKTSLVATGLAQQSWQLILSQKKMRFPACLKFIVISI